MSMKCCSLVECEFSFFALNTCRAENVYAKLTYSYTFQANKHIKRRLLWGTLVQMYTQ